MANPLIRAGLTIAGAVFFGPVGALVGGLVGSFLFPDDAPHGPRINELNVQTSTVGAPIQIRYGTASGAGNVIWYGGLIPHEHAGESGGKGAPSGPATTSYTIDVAIGICDGEDGSPAQPAGIRRIWADADLIFDASDDATLTARLELDGVDPASIAGFLASVRAMSSQLVFTFYNGAEDQLPDPTIESYETAGTVPAYRGLAYVVFTNFDVTKFGNRPPNFIIETYSGDPAECGIYSPGVLRPWVEGGLDPRNHTYLETYRYSGDGGVTYTAVFADAAADAEVTNGKQLFTSDAYLHGWERLTDSNNQSPCDGVATSDAINLRLLYNVIASNLRGCTPVVGPGTNSCDKMFNLYGVGNPVHLNGAQRGFFVIVDNAPGDVGEEAYFNGYSGSGSVGCADSDHFETDIGDSGIRVRRSLEPPVIYSGITWTLVSGTFKVLQEYADTGPPNGVVTQYPVGPCLPLGHPDYNNQAFWDAAYADAVAAGEPLVVDPVYGTPDGYPSIQSTAYLSDCSAVDAACVPMPSIVADICRRSGLRTDTGTQIDVSDLTSCVPGYIIGRQMPARDALGPLRMFGLFDAVESGDVLKFIERGHATVATLTTDDLGAHESGSEVPPSVEVSRMQEKDLPRRVRLHFPNYDHDHEPSEQSASRLSTEATNEVDIELAVSMSPDTAAQLAEIMLYAEWVGRSTFTFSLDNDWLKLEPTDCIEIPVEGETRRVRIVAVNYKIGGIIEVEAQQDDDGSYVSTVVAQPGVPSGGLPGSGGNGPICHSEVVLLDLKALPGREDIDTDAGYYAAVYGLCPDSWTCAELYRSADGGLTYGRVGRASLQATVGTIDIITGPATDPVLPGESPPYDTSTSITVTLYNGTLESITDAQIAAGRNLAAIGIDGRWVLIQYKTATLDTGDQWTLTDLIWGINDTQHLLYTTQAGDTFVLLSDPAIIRIAETPDNIGVEKQLKILTCGESLDGVDPFNFTTWGLSYRRLCPSTVISCSTVTPPSFALDGDAYFLPTDTSLTDEWADHGGEIAHWSNETNSWVFCTPAAGTILHCSDEDVDVIPPGGGGVPTPAPWAPATGSQAGIQFKDEGSNLGSSGTVDTVDIVGAALTATHASNTVTITTTAVVGPGSSTDEAIARFDGTTGKLIQNSGTLLDNSDILTTPNASAAEIGFKGEPQRVISANDSLLLADAGGQVYKSSGGAVTVTIPANSGGSSVAFPIGTCIEIINDDTETMSIVITTDTLVMSPSGATGSRSLAARGWAIIKKVTSTRWFISGAGLT